MFRHALRALGYVDGENIAIEYRYADGNYDRLPVLAAELVRLKVDVVVTEGTPPTRVAKQATITIPRAASFFSDCCCLCGHLRLACPRPIHKGQGEAHAPGSQARQVQGSQGPCHTQVA